MSDSARPTQVQDQPKAQDQGKDTKKKGGLLNALKPGGRDPDDPDKKKGGILDKLKPGGRDDYDPDKKTGRSTVENLKASIKPPLPKSLQPGNGDPGSTGYAMSSGTGMKHVPEGDVHRSY